MRKDFYNIGPCFIVLTSNLQSTIFSRKHIFGVAAIS
jgi:hypothetical protein